MDPTSNLSGGFDWTRFSDGGLDRSYEVIRRASGQAVSSHMFAKANALGEVELLSDAAPVEIGNRIWFDANQDGLQGANEAGMPGITVALYADFNNDGIPDGAVLASVITNASGEWYFNNSNIADGDPVTPGNQPGLKHGAGYIVRIGTEDWDTASGIGINELAYFFLTATDALSNGTPDIADSDAVLTTGVIRVPQIRFVAGLAGQNNHNLDFGFSDNPLPLSLISFTAQLNSNNQANLKWTTVSEVDFSHFVIEKSTDGIHFADAATVLAAGNAADITNYNFLDNINVNGTALLYYRLRSVDMDGKFHLSAIRVLRIGKEAYNYINILAYPNPVTNELRITIPANWQTKKVTYELFNGNGQAATRKETASSSQTETLHVNSLAPGFYIVRVSCNGETAQQKIIKK